MTFDDIIKKSFIEQFSNGDITCVGILLTLLISMLIGFYIFFIYRTACNKAFYSKSFAISLVSITLITACVIMTVKSNLIISLGMVGALSIVRFRTPIKEPLDLAFLFWAIAVGIICGANLYQIALVGSLIITIAILVLHFIPNIKQTNLLFISTPNINSEEKIENLIKENTNYLKIKSKNKTIGKLDLIYEINSENENLLLEKISKLEDITKVNILSQESDFN